MRDLALWLLRPVARATRRIRQFLCPHPASVPVAWVNGFGTPIAVCRCLRCQLERPQVVPGAPGRIRA